jgi:hypothetical protein
MGSPLLEKLTDGLPLLTRGTGRLSAASHSRVSASKKKKKSKNNACKNQAQVWTTLINIECEASPDPSCPALLACGDSLETCDFSGFFTCFQAVESGP